MDSVAQNLLWLVWETSLEAKSSPETLVAFPAVTDPRVSDGAAIALGRRSLAIAAGAIVLGNSFGAPALAASDRFGNTIYVATPEGYALNVRWGPSTRNGVYRRVARGTALQVSGVRRNGWVQLVDATWVAGNLVSTYPVGTAPPPVDNRNLATVVTPQGFALNVRNGPGINYGVVAQYLNGSQIPLTGRFNVGWAQLLNGNWVDSKYLRYSGPIENITRPPITPPGPTPNADVMELQRLLRQAGFLPSNFIVTGIYDATTQAAVREFQRVNGLPVTGTVDAATWQALYRATTPTPLPSPSPNPSPDPTTPPPGGSRQMRVVTDGESTPVFNGPGTEFSLVRTVPNGSIVTVTGRTSGNWSELSDGNWIFSLWLEPI
ncbi:peptidoglycan-binding protein [Nodosilinea nodulosa]|uniref:peptidoglycan-binding protein n=1 Tax=Nodosilinea nodulosa TaxID=416001 RepID=UPI0002F27DD5|nr:peptidoglycan-binding protein [Nodosilinea nodulosa]